MYPNNYVFLPHKFYLPLVVENNETKIYYATSPLLFISASACTPNFPPTFRFLHSLCFLPIFFFTPSSQCLFYSSFSGPSVSLIQAPTSGPSGPWCYRCRHPLQTFELQISTSISQLYFLFCITDVDICFRQLRCRCRHPFRIFFCFLVLWVSTSASDNCIEDVDISFIFFFMYYECQHPLQTVALQMSTSVSYLFFLVLRDIRFIHSHP